MATQLIHRKELAREFADRNNIGIADAEATIKQVFGLMTLHLKKKHAVQVYGFGKFVPVQRKARKARNPATGESVHVKAHRVVRFSASDTLKAAVK